MSTAFCCVGASAQNALGISAMAQSRPANNAAMAEEEESAPLKSDASHQGIKVHGHWKIVVKNQDGSIAQTREFENSMTLNGGQALTRVLTGSSSTAGFGIGLATGGTSTCANSSCVMVPSISTGIGSYICVVGTFQCTAGMTTTVSSSAASYVLAGQYTASRAGTITQGFSYIGECAASVSPTSCLNSTSSVTGAGNFTTQTFPAITVAANQLVQVTVTISFA